MHVKKKRGDSYLIMLFGYIVLLGNTAWYIWGNVLYFQEEKTCNPAIPHPNPEDVT